MAVSVKFKAAIFDFDGTVTEKGIYGPSQKMANALLKLAKKMPIAFCTGRQLESFEKRGLGYLLQEINKKERNKFLQNLFLCAENGAVGYYFDTKKNDFTEFYRVDWPDNFFDKEKLRTILGKAIKKYGSIYYNAHRIVIVMRTKLHDYENRKVEEVYKLSEKIFEITVKVLKKIDPEFEKFLHVGNSGIGVIVGPANGDKDVGIKKFAEFLVRRRKMKFSPKIKEILVIGDSPQIGGNDHYFLSGRYGTPFSVGPISNGSVGVIGEVLGVVAKPVIDKNGKQLLHEGGTLKLIEGLLNSLF